MSVNSALILSIIGDAIGIAGFAMNLHFQSNPKRRSGDGCLSPLRLSYPSVLRFITAVSYQESKIFIDKRVLYVNIIRLVTVRSIYWKL